jgi:hypothetical protein
MRRGSKALTVIEAGRGEVPSREAGAQDKVYGAYLESLNPRTNRDIQEALASSPDVRFREFLERIMAPRYKRNSLQAIAKACNIALLDFNEWVQKASTQRALAAAQVGSVRVANDMVEDAVSKTVTCDRCDGLSWVSAPPGLPNTTPGYRRVNADASNPLYGRTCPKCSGGGTMRQIGDQHARDRILEISGLTKKGGGVSITQNFGGAYHGSAIGTLDNMMAIDAEFEDTP